MIEDMLRNGKGVVIKEIIEDHDVKDVVRKKFYCERKLSQDSLEKPKEVKMEEHMYDEFDDVMYDTYDGASISGYESDLETWMGDDGNMIYTILLFDELGQAIEAKEVVDLLGELDEALGEHVIDLVNDANMVPIVVVAEEMLEDQARVIKRRREMAKKKNEDNAQ
nr:hypothetical protein [Tanacetum cinerariifolium]